MVTEKRRTGKACIPQISQSSESKCWQGDKQRRVSHSELTGELGGKKKVKCQAGKVRESNTASQGAGPEGEAAVGLFMSRRATSRETHVWGGPQGVRRIQTKEFSPVLAEGLMGLEDPGDVEGEWARMAEA